MVEPNCQQGIGVSFFSKKLLISLSSLPSWEGEVSRWKKTNKLLQLMTHYNFRTVVGKLLVLGPNPSPGQFLCGTPAKDGFSVLKWLGGIERGATFHDVWKLCEIQMSVFVNHVLWKQSHAIALPVVCGLGHTPWRSWVLMTRDWPCDWQSLKYLQTGPLQSRLQSLFRGFGRDWRSICQRPCWDNISIGTKTQWFCIVLAHFQEPTESLNCRMGVRENSGTRVHSCAINNTQVLSFPPGRVCSPLLRGHRVYTSGLQERFYLSGCLFFLMKKSILSRWKCWAVCSEMSW